MFSRCFSPTLIVPDAVLESPQLLHCPKHKSISYHIKTTQIIIILLGILENTIC